MVIECPHSTLRSWQVGDEEMLVRHANNYNVWRTLDDKFPHPYTMLDAIEWISLNHNQSPVTNFAIIVDGSVAGGIGFTVQENVFRKSAELGYWLGESFWNRGIITDAIRAVTEYAFSNFDLCRLYARVFEINQPSIKALEKSGYVCEARLKKAVVKEGVVMDALIYVTLQ